MEISIIIPIYNVECYIADCIRSVMAQTMREGVECILVDDCGQDNSMAIAEKMIAEYQGPILFKILHHSHNKGQSGARNTGLRAASGRYIYFLDSDDEMTSSCLSLLYEPLKRQDYDMVVGNYKVVGGENFPKLKMATGDAIYDDAVASSYLAGLWMSTVWNKLYNFEYIKRESLSFKEGIIHEDELWSLEIASSARSIYAVNEETYIYKIRPNSTMTSIANAEGQLKTLCTLKQVLLAYSVFLCERGKIHIPTHFSLFAMFFEVTVAHSKHIGKEEYSKTFDYCHDLVRLSLKDFWAIHRSNLHMLAADLHLILPKKCGFLYYVLIHDVMGKALRVLRGKEHLAN